MTADRDVIRVRMDGEDDTVDINEGTRLIAGARDMLLATACSLQDPKPLYRTGANLKASDYLSALTATKQATERTIGGDSEAFTSAVASGASANLCDALAQMIEPFPMLDIRVTWARTRPRQVARHTFRFTRDEAPILSEAARAFRSREPQPDVRLLCSVQKLRRDDEEMDGTVTLRTAIENKIQSVKAVLSQRDYDQAIEAHKGKMPVIVEGDLEKFGQRQRLLNPRIVAVITDKDTERD